MKNLPGIPPRLTGEGMATRKRTAKEVLDELDRRCAIAAREYMPDPDAGEYASDMHRDPFPEVREWILSLRG